MCRLLWRLDNNGSFHVQTVTCGGVVVLTNVLYIFLLVSIFDPSAGDCGVLQGKKGMAYVGGSSAQARLSRFEKKMQFYQGLSSKYKSLSLQ